MECPNEKNQGDLERLSKIGLAEDASASIVILAMSKFNRIFLTA